MRRVRGGTRNAMCNKGFLTRGPGGGEKETSDKNFGMGKANANK